jgi:hypothetical protein
MKERRSLSVEDIGVAAASVGRNGFVPTQEWVCNILLFSWNKLILCSGDLVASRVGLVLYPDR